MISSRDLVTTSVMLAVLVFGVPAAAGLGEASSDESVSEGHGSTEHTFHRNHFGGFLGASTHFDDNDETAYTLGLEYARQFSPRWAISAYTELASGNIERDIIFAVGAIFYPMARLGVVLAPGVEFVDKDVEQHGEIEQEKEAEFLLRLGVAYGFPVGAAGLGPTVFADWAGDRWTLVLGIGFVAGF